MTDPSGLIAPARHLSRLQLRHIYLLTLVIFCFGCGVSSERRTVPPEVEAAIGTVGDHIAAERYEQVYAEAADLWRQDSTLEQSIGTFKTLRTKLGPVENRVMQSAREQENASGPMQGRAFIVTYRTKFQLGEGMETFTLLQRNGQWQLARYFVNSTALQ